MARLLMKALEMSGNEVTVVSELRGFMRSSVEDPANDVARAIRDERASLISQWKDGGRPDLWLTYHNYYKTPDMLGPPIASEFDIPYVTAEASYARRHDEGGWAANQRIVADGVRQAAVNLCLTERDRAGLAAAVPGGRYARLLPFIDTASFLPPRERNAAPRLMTVAMMRPGDKLNSYVMLAEALRLIDDRPWTLTVVGGGPSMTEVRDLFSYLPAGRVAWLGELSEADVLAELNKGGIYVWPGCGEAYGLAYLEAQAAGLPVIAQHTAGVPEVVVDQVTGLLTPSSDVPAFAAAIGALLQDGQKRDEMAAAARRFVLEERSLSIAAARLDDILRQYLGGAYV